MSVKVTLEIGHEAILKHKPTPDGFTHDWELYVKGCDGKDISHFIEKVVFNLHESFPKPKRVIKEPPYVLKESGYAGFLLPIDIYLKNRDEPKKASFNYDLMLQANTTYRRAQKEKIVIGNPTDEFRRKLLRGGGELINNSVNSMDDKHKDLNDEKTQLLSKPKLGGDNSNSGTSKKHKHRPDESKASSTFANLFGTPITKTSNKVSPDAKNSKHSPNQLTSKSSSSNKNQEKSVGKEKDKEKSEKSSSKHKHNSPYKDKDLRKNNNNTASSESLVEKQRDGSVGKTNNSSSSKKEKPHSKERERSREKNSLKKSSSSPKRSGSNSSSSLQQSIIPPPPSTISPARNSTSAAVSLLDSSNYLNNNSNNSSSSIIKNHTTQNSNSKVETNVGGGSGTKKSKKDKKEKNHDKDHRERDKRDKDKSKELLHQHNTNSNSGIATNNNKFSIERFELKTNSNSSINSKDKEFNLKDNNKIQPPVTVSQQSQDGYPNNHRISTGETLPISTPSSTSSDRKHKHHKKKDKNKKDLKTDNVTNTGTAHKEKSEVRKKERNQDKLNSGSSKNFDYSKKSDDRAATAVPPVTNTVATIKSNNVNNLTAIGANPQLAHIREPSDKESEGESSDIDNHTNNNANSNNLNHNSPLTSNIAQSMPASIDKSDLVNENSNHIVNSNSSNSNLTKSQKSKEKLTESNTSSSGGGKGKNSRKRNALSANLMEPPSTTNQTTSVKSAKRSSGGVAASTVAVTDDNLVPPNNPSSSATVAIQPYLNSGGTNNNNNNIFDSDNVPQLPLDYMNELKELQHKIMTLKDNNDLQQVVELIAATGRYEITSKTFDFDLCVLDRLTVQRLQEFFATLS